MSGNNLAVRITADIVDLQTKFAVARAEVNALTSDMNKLARESAKGTIDAAGQDRLKQLSEDLLHARVEAGQYASELNKAGIAVGGFAGRMEAGHGSIATATREFRALFDELTSGRTRQTPGTLAIIATRVLGLGPATLGVIGGVAALAGGLGYLAYRAIEASNAIDKIDIGAKFSGNLALTQNQIKQFSDELSKAKGISSSDAREITGAFSTLHDITAPQIQALTSIVSDFAQVTGQEATKAAEELTKSFSDKSSAADFAKSLGGITQAQINAAEAADRSGNAQAIFAAKFQALNTALDRARGSLDEHNSKVTSSFKNYIAYFGMLDSGLTVEEAQKELIDEQNKAREKQVALLKQLGASMTAMPPSPEQILKVGVSTAEKENPIAKQIEEANAKIHEMNSALGVAYARGDQVNIDKLNAGLTKAQEELSALQFGPVLERMRRDMEQLASTWDGTQSGLLAKQREVARAALNETQANSKEYLAIQQEIARLDVQTRQSAGQEIIANARAQIATITGDTSHSAIARLEIERDTWQQVLAGERLTAAQRVEVQRSFNQTVAELNKERQAQAQAITKSDVDSDIAIARLRIEARRETLDIDIQSGQIAAARKLEILKNLTTQEYELNVRALQDQLAMLKEQPVEYEHVYNQIRELKEKLNLDLAKLDKQAAADARAQARDQLTAWRGVIDAIESSESRMVSDVIGKRTTLKQAVLNMGQELVTRELQNDLRAMTTRLLMARTEETAKKSFEQGGILFHLFGETQKTAATSAGTAARTSAVTAGAAAQTAATTAAAIEGHETTSKIGAKEVMADAARAFSGTYAAIAKIPYIGPFLAPVLAAGAYAAVAAYEGMASLDVGAWDVPNDMVAQIHKGESVVPTTFAEGMRQAMGGGGNIASPGGGGGVVTINIQAWDSQDVTRVLSQHGRTIASIMRGQQRLFNGQ